MTGSIEASRNDYPQGSNVTDLHTASYLLNYIEFHCMFPASYMIYFVMQRIT